MPSDMPLVLFENGRHAYGLESQLLKIHTCTRALSKAVPLLRSQGPRWLAFRSWYALKHRVRWFERTLPCGDWNSQCHGRLRRDLAVAALSPALREFGTSTAIQRAESILAGSLTWFSAHAFPVGFPPPWFEDPWAASQTPPDLRHWSRLDEFAAADIKVVWEQGRFGFVFPLVRAFAKTGDQRYVEGFWTALEDWRQQNPPQCGPHWKCGQEVALRLMSLAFGFLSFSDQAATTPQREAVLAEVLEVSAHRIEANIAYALSQNNNHGVSEAAGLFTAGIVLDRLAWIRKGRELLDQLAGELIYDDGSFSQHSTNYHRLMLHVYLWAIRLGEVAGYPLPRRVVDRIRVAGHWLRALVDAETGRAPNLGANDGAHFLDLTDLDYLDFRPTVQAVGAIVDHVAWLPAGAWDELALWLGADWTASHRMHRDEGSYYLADGGYAVFHRHQSLALFRCPQQFRHRPVQCDLLHLDLWDRGTNILRDSGTFSYNCDRRWQDYFSGPAAHNTVGFDEHDQMPRLGRFLFGHWPVLTIENRLQDDTPSIAAQFVDWKGCQHRRSVAVTPAGFRIVDQVRGYREKAVLRWRLAPEWKWALHGDECRSEACTIRVTAQSDAVTRQLTTGWESLRYFEKTQVPVLQASIESNPQEFTTDILLRK